MNKSPAKVKSPRLTRHLAKRTGRAPSSPRALQAALERRASSAKRKSSDHRVVVENSPRRRPPAPVEDVASPGPTPSPSRPNSMNVDADAHGDQRHLDDLDRPVDNDEDYEDVDEDYEGFIARPAPSSRAERTRSTGSPRRGSRSRSSPRALDLLGLRNGVNNLVSQFLARSSKRLGPHGDWLVADLTNTVHASAIKSLLDGLHSDLTSIYGEDAEVWESKKLSKFILSALREGIPVLETCIDNMSVGGTTTVTWSEAYSTLIDVVNGGSDGRNVFLHFMNHYQFTAHGFTPCLQEIRSVLKTVKATCVEDVCAWLLFWKMYTSNSGLATDVLNNALISGVPKLTTGNIHHAFTRVNMAVHEGMEVAASARGNHRNRGLKRAYVDPPKVRPQSAVLGSAPTAFPVIPAQVPVPVVQVNPPPTVHDEAAVQRMSDAEREALKKNNCCFYCRKMGHFKYQCPLLVTR